MRHYKGRMRNVVCGLSLVALLSAVACTGDDDVEPGAEPSIDAGTTPPVDARAPSPDAGPQDVELRFEAKVGARAFSCAETYELGTSSTAAVIRDLRAYVHQVELVDATGARVPVALTADGLWQTDRVALLDFENGQDNCRNGTKETNLVLRGRVRPGDYRGISFRVGVPKDLNHVDPSVASSPLTLSTMHWTWNAGYLFARIDAERVMDGDAGMGDGGMHDMGDGGMGMGDGGMSHGPAGVFLMHLGSTGCSGEAASGETVQCARENLGGVELTGFDPLRTPIVVDLAALFAESDLAAEDRGGSPGCMSSPDDPECAPLLPRVGADAAGSLSPATQKLFRAP